MSPEEKAAAHHEAVDQSGTIPAGVRTAYERLIKELWQARVPLSALLLDTNDVAAALGGVHAQRVHQLVRNRQLLPAIRKGEKTSTTLLFALVDVDELRVSRGLGRIIEAPEVIGTS